MPRVKSNATRFYVFTINNPSHHDDEQLRDLSANSTYLIYGRETGENNTPHYQGYVELARSQRFSWIKRRLTRAHIERKSRNSTRSQARDYCKKDGDWQEIGTFRPDQSGKRNDMLVIRDRIAAGDDIDDLEFEFFPQFVRYGRFFRDFYNRQQKPRTQPPKVYVYWGASGTGKTRKAHEHDDAAIISFTGTFFQGYKNQKTVIFDELDDPVLKFGRSLWLQLTDRYPMTVNIKNGERVWNPETIVITTNSEPIWFINDQAVKRRITSVEKFG